MNNFRKINPSELTDLAAKLKYIDLINIEWACSRAAEFFGPTVTSIKLIAGPEYNDSGYDFNISDIKGFCGNEELKNLDTGKYKDNFNDWMYSLRGSTKISEYSPESEIVINVLNKRIEGIPDLYIKE